MASKVTQSPTIIGITGSTIRIKHPDISGYTRTSMTAPLSAGGTGLVVRDNNNFEDNDWFIFGEVGNGKTEECDVNGAVTRGTSLTITNSCKFAHEVDTPITRIIERAVKIYGASTDGGAGTLIASVDAISSPIADAVQIQWDRPYTEWTLISTDTSYAYYYATFTDGTTESSASDYVPASGLAYNTALAIVKEGLDLARAEVDGKLITWEYLLTLINDFQDEVANYVLPNGVVKDWPFEIFEDKTSLTITQNENAYAVSGLSSTLKYPDSFQGIIQVKIGADEIEYQDLDEFEQDMDGVVKTAVATQASVGATSIVLDDTYELGESGQIYISTQSTPITYTANSESTSTLSGIPASGTGSITATATVDATVWQNIAPTTPDKYTLFNDQILLNKPPDSDTAGKKIKVKAYKALDRISSISDVVPIPFAHIGKYFIASQIEYRKKDDARGERFMAQFEEKLGKEAVKQMNQVPEVQYRYVFETSQNN